MKPKIEYISFGRKRIKVRFEKLKELDGYFETQKKEIVLDNTIKGKRLFNTILHEIFHVIVFYRKLKCKENSEEKLATEIGNSYTKIFKQNPKLWRLLTKLIK